MAGSEGSGQTELLSGWSCVVHRPSEDPEPSELPSTVDMAAFTSGLSVEPSQNADDEESCDSESDSESDSNNSGSDGSGSCSQSDSSDTESSSSSQESSSRSSSPEFSVTSSQTDGLRLKIATVRKSCTSPSDKSKSESKPVPDNKVSEKNNITKTCTTLSSSSDESQGTGGSSESSSDSEACSANKSDTAIKANDNNLEKNVNVKKPAAKVIIKPVDKVDKRATRAVAVASSPKLSVKNRTRPRRTRKIASLPLSRGSTGSSSDSEDGSETDRTMLASCSLQEIRQEDLAAILPDQQECDAFEDFDCRNDKDSPHTGDGSGSDMELPQQAVNALILRTESSSESESRLPPNPSTLYANNFLQQFVAQTQLLNISTSTPAIISETNPNNIQSTDTNLTSTTDLSSTKRKRGRPKKSNSLKLQAESYKSDKPETNIEYCGNPNVSPDSGIQNSSDHVSSPEPSPSPNPKIKIKEDTTVLKNHSIIRVQRSETSVQYASAERILYQPLRKVGRPVIRKGPGRPPKHKRVSRILHEVNHCNKNAAIEVNKLNRIALKSEKYNKVRNTRIVSNNLETKPKMKDVQKKLKAPLIQEVCDKVGRHLECPEFIENKKSRRKPRKKVNNKILLGNKNKSECLKTKYATLKNAKVMHSKHNDKRHKKCKFKILKPISTTPIDPKLNTEIDRLVIDFVKLCNISIVPKPSKENVPELVKALKKVSKKRKTFEYSERKKKKQSVNNLVNKEASSNEQRLPLKKRHYHVSTNNDVGNLSSETVSETNLKLTVPEKDVKNGISNNSVKTHEKSAKIMTRNTAPEQNVDVTPLPQDTNLNNNDYSTTNRSKLGKVDVHINEAIEACITKYAAVLEPPAKCTRSPKPTKAETPKPTTKPDISKQSKTESETIELSPVKAEENAIASNTSIATTTPKKRHRLEVKNKSEELASVTDIIVETVKNEKQAAAKTLETVVSELKAKKTAPVKISLISEKKQDNVTHIMTRKKNRLEDLTLTLANKVGSVLPAESLENVQKRKKDDTSTKKPKADLEKVDLSITSEPTEMSIPTVGREVDLQPKSVSPTIDLSKIKLEDVSVVGVENLCFKEPSVVLIKTEIGSMLSTDYSPRRKMRKRRAYNRTGFPTAKKKKKRAFSTETPLPISEDTPQVVEETEEKTCDRVPQEGEKYSAFLQRTEKTNIASAILEKLQKCIVSTPNLTEQQIAKWNEEESMYALGILKDGRPASRLSMKECRGLSPSVSIETRSSDKRSDGEPDERNLETRLELSKGKKSKIDMRIRSLRYSSLQKRRLRDVSPASSNEPCSDKRSKEEVLISGDEGKGIKKTSKGKKKYLTAGLSSDYLKENNEAASSRRSQATPKRLSGKPEEHPCGVLPPPIQCGKPLRTERRSLLLPSDILPQHKNSQSAGRDAVPSWNYRKIRTNMYNVKNNGGACEPQACNCSSESGCGDDCINRLVFAECPANHKCRNQRIQKHDYAPGLEKFMTNEKGWGVRTKFPIKSGEFILEYVGEVVSDTEFKERMATRYASDTHHYCLHLDGGLVIDGHRMGGHGRFVNHSCEPNCEIQKWSVNGQFRMALFALRDIEAYEELTYDYNFSLFNPVEGQECKCGSSKCRGVIGGKTQRVVRQSLVSTPVPPSIMTPNLGRKGRPRKKKAKAKREPSVPKETKDTAVVIPPPVSALAPAVVPTPPSCNITPATVAKPLNNVQKLYIREHHCFLVRNSSRSKHRPSVSRPNTVTPNVNSTSLANNLNALRKPRNIKTRRLAQAEDNPELKKAAKLAGSLRDLLDIVTHAKDEKNELLCSPFVVLPSKRKMPNYYQRISNPIDLTTIEKKISAGNYTSIDKFDTDVLRIFVNAVKFYGRTSDLGISAARLRKIYYESKKQNVTKIEEAIGEKLPAGFIPNKKKGDEEDVIRCICGMYHDEGLMIQCERCLVWQHSECVGADAKTPSFHCERCVPRKVQYEIALDEFTEHGHRYYMTLLRGDLQLRQGDTVYVLRDITIPGTKRKHNYKTIEHIKYSDLDIFRIERLWKDSKSGQRFAYGHHYLRPHETFHEPTRKFFPNEVMRVPLYEAVPVELVISHCWVLDINTFCKGRPIGAPEEHIYICEYRVDKTAHLFMKNSKGRYPICTKAYAFEKFEVRLKITRTYAPHDLDPALLKQRGRKMLDNENLKYLPQLPVHVPPVTRTPKEKKARLNKILLNLLNKMPTKQPLDVSYLLEGGRRRKKPVEK